MDISRKTRNIARIIAKYGAFQNRLGTVMLMFVGFLLMTGGKIIIPTSNDEWQTVVKLPQNRIAGIALVAITVYLYFIPPRMQVKLNEKVKLLAKRVWQI
jgi:hypothetical protein